jgi:hypothetical protein
MNLVTGLIALASFIVSIIMAYRAFTDPGPGQIELAIRDVASAIRELERPQ